MAIDMRKKKKEEQRSWDTEFAQAPFVGSSGVKYENTPKTTTASTEPVVKGVPLQGESPYKAPPSNYDIYPNTNYAADALKAESEGRFNDAAHLWSMRDEKIDAGYGGNYEKFNPYQYDSRYGDKIKDLRGQYENYEDFSYDPLKDEAYRSIAGVYSKNASDAAANALGQAAAANGGRMSSNAIIASNLAYQNKMAGLEAEIPQLRELAYRMYLGDKEDLRTTLNDYMYQEQQDYNRWAEALDRRISNQKYANEQNAQRYMNEIMTFGKVVSPEAAQYFGVDIGTASHDALVNRRNYDLSASEFLKYVTPNVANDSGMYDLANMPTLSREEYEYGKYADARDYTRSAYENDRDYARSVYENDRNYARDVYESDRDWNKKNGGSVSYGGVSGGSSGGGSVNYNPTVNSPVPSSGNVESVYDAAVRNGRNITDVANYISKAVQNGEITDDDGEMLMKRLLG